MQRPSHSAAAAFLVALCLSLFLHVDVVGTLAVVGAWQQHEAEHHGQGVEIEVSVLEEEEEPEPEPEAEVPPPPERRRRRRPEPEPEPEPEPRLTVPAVPVPVRPPPAQLQAIKQRSHDPSVAAPEAPRFVAEENRRVEEETVARLRNMQRDDPEPQAGATARSEVEELGNADDESIQDARNRPGHEARMATEQEAHLDSLPPDPAPATEARPELAREEGREIEVSDGFGTIRIVRRPAQDAQTGRSARPERRRMTWSDATQVYSERELREERQQYARERQSRIRGSDRQRNWREFRAAIENFVPNVRPGNQTALNAAASPFANYIAHVHRRIHRQYAQRFLRNLPGGSLSAFADQSLRTKLEIIINRDGTVHRIGVVETSGLLAFDLGAYTSVMRGQPYPEAPTQIVSGDGKVYMHWGFYRNGRQCGTFNVNPYILPHPPGTPQPRPGPLQDGLEQNSVVPDTAEATWGLETPPAEETAEGEEAPTGETPAGEAPPPTGETGDEPRTPPEEERTPGAEPERVPEPEPPRQPAEPGPRAPRAPPGAAIG